jgi:hypothetical protein
MDGKDGEQSALLRPTQLRSSTIDQDVEWAKQPELHGAPPSAVNFS